MAMTPARSFSLSSHLLSRGEARGEILSWPRLLSDPGMWPVTWECLQGRPSSLQEDESQPRRCLPSPPHQGLPVRGGAVCWAVGPHQKDLLGCRP